MRGRWARQWKHAALAGICAAAALLWPLPAALPRSDARAVRAAALTACLLVCGAAMLASRRGRPAMWLTVAGLAGAAAVAGFTVHYDAAHRCVASYDGRPVVIGRQFTRLAQDYVARGNAPTVDDLLLDAGGRAELIWTPDSIARCRLLLGWMGVLPLPLLAVSACALMQAAAPRLPLPAGAAPAVSQDGERDYRYDAFFSYRHAEPDRGLALRLVEYLEDAGFRAAIDVRDFRPNEHVITEMERCIKESRFVLCLVSSRYLASDHCVEEAVISKSLDLTERKRRLVPLLCERLPLPVWLHGLVGLDLTDASAVDPFEKLSALLAERKEKLE